MGIFSNLFNNSGKNKKSFFDLSWAGIGVESSLGTVEDALKNNLVWSAVNLISGAVASLPLNVYNNTKEGREISTGAFAQAMKGKINGFQTSDTFKNQIMVSLLLRGKAFAYKDRDFYNNVVGLIPLNPDKVEVILNDRQKVFKTGNSVFTENEVIHFVGLSVDGVDGVSVIEYQADPVVLNNTIRKFGKNFFRNGANLSGVIKATNEKITAESVERLKTNWSNASSGVNNSGKTPVLPFGFDFQKIEISAKDAVLIEAMQAGVLDVARMFNLPPHLLADLTKSSYSSIEAQGLEFLQFCLLPWIRRIETAINANLYPDGKSFVEFNVNAFARGTLRDRFDAYGVGHEKGFLTANEIRKMENLPPLPGGDALLVPINTAQATETSAGPKLLKRRGRPPKVKPQEETNGGQYELG